MRPDDSSSEPWSRRKILRSVGAAGAVGLAGCSSNDDGNGGEDGNSDKWLRLPEPQAEGRPDDPQWNIYGKQTITYPPLNEKLIDWNPETEEWVDHATTFDFNSGEQYFDVTLKEDVVWYPGGEERVTAQDISIGIRLDLAAPDSSGQGLEDFVEEVEILDDYTLRYHMDDEYNKDLVFLKLIHSGTGTKWEYYGEHVEAVENAETDEDANAAFTELQEMRIEEPHYTGMFEWDGIEAQQVTLPKNEDHRNADYVDFEGIKYSYIGSAQKHWGELLSNNIDIYDDRQTLITGSMAQTKPDHVKLVQRQQNGGLSLIPNRNTTDGLASHHVRRALAYYIDREQVADNTNAFNKDPAPTPLSTLSEAGQKPVADRLDAFMEYGPESMPEKGDEEMRKAGWSKEDGQWVNENGESPEWPINVSADMGEWLSAARSVSQQLKDQGLNTPLSANEHTSHWDAYFAAEFDGFSMGYAGHPASPAAYQQLWLSMLRPKIPGPASGVEPESMDVPMPIGEGEGDIQTLDIESEVRLLETSNDEDARKDAIEQAAWAFNSTLPHVPLLVGRHTAAYSDRRFELPAPDDPQVSERLLEIQFIPYHTLRNDLISSR